MDIDFENMFRNEESLYLSPTSAESVAKHLEKNQEPGTMDGGKAIIGDTVDGIRKVIPVISSSIEETMFIFLYYTTVNNVVM